MRSYGRVDEDLDDFIDDQDGGDVGAYRYADEEEDEGEEEEDEVEEEPVSEEALKLFKYRQKLKEQLRSKLRQENGSSSRDQVRKPLPLNNFGSYFGPSKPVIADRVIQESKALLETWHLAPKVPSSINNGKKVSVPSSSGTKNGVSCQPSANQLKSKAQIIKQTRDYSFLVSEDADPKLAKDLGQTRNFSQRLDARPAQVPQKSNGQLAQSGRKVVYASEQRKSFGIPQVCSTRTAPVRKLTPDNRASVVSSESRMQLDMRKQPQPTKQMGSGTGNGSVGHPFARPLPTKRLSSSFDKQMPSGSVEKKVSAAPSSNRAPPVQWHNAPNGQRIPGEKSRISGVTKPLEHKRSAQQSSDNREFKKQNIAASKIEVKPPKQSIHRANLDRDHTRVQNPHGQLSAHKQSGGVSKCSNVRKRRAEEDDFDFRSQIRQMFGYNPSRYRDDDDDDDMMEVGFDTIHQEEIRSAKIAKKEDDEEYEKILEEERQERLRKKAKMRKMNQR